MMISELLLIPSRIRWWPIKLGEKLKNDSPQLLETEIENSKKNNEVKWNDLWYSILQTWHQLILPAILPIDPRRGAPRGTFVADLPALSASACCSSC